VSLAFPSLAVVSPGTPITSALWMSNVYNGLTYLSNPPAATLVQTSATTSLTSGTWGAIGFDSSTFDNYGMHSNVTNTSRATIQQAGKYLIAGTVAFAFNASGDRGAKIMKNGAVVQGPYSLSPTSSGHTPSVATAGFILPCAVGDYLELAGYQNSGGALNTLISVDQSSSLTVIWLSE